jgi:hypothetical protein
LIPHLNLLTAFPPVRAPVIEHRLWRRLGLGQVGRFCRLIDGYRLTFFLTDISSLDGIGRASSPFHSV